jgi:hypothetical protein
MESTLLKVISAGNNDELERRLRDDPSNVFVKTDTGASLLQYAVYCHNNRAVDVIKKYKPGLDVYEAACEEIMSGLHIC